MSARRKQPAGPRTPRESGTYGGRKKPPTKVPWLPYAIGAFAVAVVLTAIIYTAVNGRLF
ncbi:hypothetical protein [Naasia lichenicola]|uniref:Uncharacterized protein n=1 Tax=Naasia lichenicola TaxID=2565933 RepID=A0A4S4FQV9_9MICO|nr:hypothetical protein [Naasia lichenicola]THG32262.1 hypothetical protein E6C64_04335 [Naasia lichenicola]